MHIKQCLFLCVTLIFSGLKPLYGQQWKIGDKTPDITFASALDKQYQQGFYKGKYLVLDFWGTWCAPCIASFPNLNALNNKFSSDKVVFATITNEPEAKIKRFFEVKKHIRLNLIKLIDVVDAVKFPEGKTFTDFKITAVPFTVVISPDGIINWVGAAHNLTEEGLMKALGMDVPLTNIAPVPTPVLQNKTEQADTVSISDFSVVLKTVQKASINAMWNNYPELNPINFSFKGAKLDYILRKFYRLPAKQVELKSIPTEDLPIVQYSIKGPRGTSWDSLAYITSEIMAKKYGYTYKVEQRESDVWQLTLSDTKKLFKNAAAFDSTTHKSGLGTYEKNVFAMNYFIHQLKEVLEQYYPTESFSFADANTEKLKGIYFDFHIPLDDWNAATIQLNSYGIKVEKVKKAIPYLVLDFSSKQGLSNK